MPRILIVSPGHPRRAGGVTDHSSRLAARWRDAGHEVRILADPTAAPPPADALLLQYVPFLYGRRGLSRDPARLLRTARTRGTRTGLFVHEPWVPPTRVPWLVLSPLQRWQLRALVRHADRTFTAVPAWRERLGPDVRLHYVGSTLGPAPEAGSRPLPGPVVFSPFAAGLRWDWIEAAVTAIGSVPPLIVLGATADDLAARPTIPTRPSWEARGRLGAPATLDALASARLVLAPFVDGLTGRRTSAAAALSTGARVLTSTGPLADPVLLAGAAAAAGTRDAFARAARELWQAPDAPEARATRRAWYRTHLDSDRLDDALLAELLAAR